MKIWLKKYKDKIFILVYSAIILVGMTKSYFFNSVQTNALPVNQKSIIIDAGHGGWDPGKVVGDLNEKDINLKISNKLLSYLEQGGCIVTSTRTDDNALDDSKRGDLKERVNLSKNDNADMLISIHQNYFPKASVKGAQVFYYKNSEESKKLAEFIQERLKELDGTNTRIAKANGEYYILKQSKIPAVIVECGFLSNSAENKKLRDEKYQASVAWAIYLGIMDYYQAA